MVIYFVSLWIVLGFKCYVSPKLSAIGSNKLRAQRKCLLITSEGLMTRAAQMSINDIRRINDA